VPLPLGAYSVTKNSAKNAPKHVNFTPKIRKISGEETQLLPQTLAFPVGDTPPHVPTPQGPPLQLDPSYATATWTPLWALTISPRLTSCIEGAYM